MQLLRTIGTNMQVINQSILKTALAVGEICIGCGCALLLMAQIVHTQVPVDVKHQREMANQTKAQRQLFWKVSSAKDPIDDGNKIIAVRRIVLHFQDVDQKGRSFANKKDLVEIEVFSKILIPVTDAAQYLIIGDRAFPEPPRSSDFHTVFAHLSPKDFSELRDGSIVSYVISAGVLDQTGLINTYKNGEPNDIAGAKFGRLNKSMIDGLPTIEEDSKSQVLRISGIENQIL